MTQTRPEHFDKRVQETAEAVRQLHPSWWRKLRSKKASESDRQWAALEIAYRLLNPDGDWGKTEIERGVSDATEDRRV